MPVVTGGPVLLHDAGVDAWLEGYGVGDDARYCNRRLVRSVALLDVTSNAR
jgi:hypothetical protein